MAATRLIALHQNKSRTVAQSLHARTDYATNPDKTEKGELVTAYGCDPFTADEAFMLQKRQFEQSFGRERTDNIIAYQIRQSFKPGEISSEEANRLGRETALRFTKGQYSFLVATHTDRAHIHNHIIFNSVSMDGTKRFRNFKFSGLALQKVSDLVCLENGLSVIQPKPYREREKRSVNLLIDIQERMKGKGPGFARWATVYNLKQMSKTLLYLRSHNIRSLDQLHVLVTEKTKQRDELLSSIRGSEQRLEEIASLKMHIINYSKTRNTYEAYRKTGYSRKFYEDHREELALHMAAKQAFDDLNVRKAPKVKDLSEEYATILAEKKAAYAKYRQVKTDAQDLLSAERNIAMLYEAGKVKESDPERNTQLEQ